VTSGILKTLNVFSIRSISESLQAEFWHFCQWLRIGAHDYFAFAGAFPAVVSVGKPLAMPPIALEGKAR
jgi:hypothetical protein